MYNHSVKLFCTAARDLENLFERSDNAKGFDESFALDRCISRLIEMQSKEYLEKESYFQAHLKKIKMNK